MRCWSAPVRFAETDQQGVVFNGHYLTWADEACTAWFDAVGTPYEALVARDLDTRVVAAALEWAGPARFRDVVEADVHCERVGTTSLLLVQTITAGSRACCRVRTTYVLVDGGGRPVRVPDDLRAAWTGTPAAG